jgi:ATP-dependent DNA helicase RecG
VGPALAGRLERLGVRSVQDLVFLLPLRYEDRTRVVPIGGVRPGQRAVIEGEVLLVEVVRRRRPMLLVALSDATGALTLRFFHFSARQQQALAAACGCAASARCAPGSAGRRWCTRNIAWWMPARPAPEEASLTPIYPGTEGLPQGRIRQLARLALAALGGARPSCCRTGRCRGHGLPPLGEALHLLHRPPPDTDAAALESAAHPARRRLALEELLAHQLAMRALRHEARRQRRGRSPAETWWSASWQRCRFR